MHVHGVVRKSCESHLVSMSIQSILMREDSNGLHSQLMSCSKDSDSDFTAIGNEDLLERTTGVVGYCSSDPTYCASRMRSLEARA